MHSASLERMFCQDGYILVPQVFNRDEMAELRRAAISRFPRNRPPFEPSFSSTALFEEPFRRVFHKPRLIEALRAVLGPDFVFINEFALHDSFYVGWHTDTSSIEAKGGHEFHWSPGFLVAQIAIYLQDNAEDGGGLDVVPASHVRDDPFAVALRRQQGLPTVTCKPEPAEPYREGVALPGRAGDVVIFHLRLSHRASRRPNPARSDAERKLAMFTVAGANNAETRRYRAWLDEYDRMNGTARAAIPDDFRCLLESLGHSVI